MKGKEEVHTGLLEKSRLCAEGCQAEARGVRPEKLLGMRLEDQDSEWPAQGLCARDQGLMAPVHTIEIADGHRGPADLFGQVVVVTEDLHAQARYVPRAGTMTRASPSITTVSPTLQIVERTARRFSGMISVMVQVAVTVSPIRTGALKRSVWLM